jgi:transporter family protein
MNRKTGVKNPSGYCSRFFANGILGWCESEPVSERKQIISMPLWLLWSLVTIVLWGTWGLVSKIASVGVDAYSNQLFYTAGLLPLMVFVGWTVHRSKASEKRERRKAGVFWAFFTGMLGGVGNIAFFEAMVKGGDASVVAPVTALFPTVTVLLALIFLKERLRRTQWLGLGLAFLAIYLLSA